MIKADRAIREGDLIDFSNLVIEEGEKVWMAFFDLYALNDDGNLYDACAIAALSCALNAKMPKLENNAIVRGEWQGKLKVDKKPILTTFAKAGNSVLLDPTVVEEKASTARFHVAINDDDFINAFQKGGAGSFTESEINGAVDLAVKSSKNVRKQI